MSLSLLVGNSIMNNTQAIARLLFHGDLQQWYHLLLTPTEHQLDLDCTCGLQIVLERAEPWLAYNNGVINTSRGTRFDVQKSSS